MTYYYWQNNELFINVYVQPRAKKNAIVGLHGERLKIQIKAIPTDDKANEELSKFLAAYLNTAPTKVSVVSGQHSRNKLIRIKNAPSDATALLQLLQT